MAHVSNIRAQSNYVNLLLVPSAYVKGSVYYLNISLYNLNVLAMKYSSCKHYSGLLGMMILHREYQHIYSVRKLIINK